MKKYFSELHELRSILITKIIKKIKKIKTVTKTAISLLRYININIYK
jgi:hypothetical protein